MAPLTFLMVFLNRFGVYAQDGLTLTRFNNTALSFPGTSTEIISSLDNISVGGHMPSSLLLSGRVAPPSAGNYGFNVSFNPPLPFPSNISYARLWVHDHLLFPINIGFSQSHTHRAGGSVPMWIPLPPRALDAKLRTIEHAGAPLLGSYEFRFEFVCLSVSGCANQKITIRWATFDEAGFPVNPEAPPPPYTSIPKTALLPAQSAPEAERRALYARLQNGWGTFWHPGMLTWTLLPEAFSVKVRIHVLQNKWRFQIFGVTRHFLTTRHVPTAPAMIFLIA